MLWIVIPMIRAASDDADGNLSNCSIADLEQSMLIAQDIVPSINIVIVADDDAALNVARRHGARGIRFESGDDINDAFAIGSDFAAVRGATAILSIDPASAVLAADALRRMATAFTGGNIVMLPNRQGLGCAALMMRPHHLPYRFGYNGVWRHLQAAGDDGIDFWIAHDRAGFSDGEETSTLTVGHEGPAS